MFNAFEEMSNEQIEEARSRVLIRKKLLENCKKTRAMDHLYSSIYQQSTFGFPVSGSSENIARMRRGDIMEYFIENYRPSNMIFSVSGSINIDMIYDCVRIGFPHVRYFHEPEVVAPPKFYSSMVKDFDNSSSDDVYVCFAYEIPDLMKSYPVLLHVDKLIGSYNRKDGKEDYSSCRIAEISAAENLCDFYETFIHLNFSSGIYGFNIKTKRDKVRDFIELVVGEFIRLASSMSENELRRASQQVAVNEVAPDDNLVTLCKKNANNIIMGPYLRASRNERLHVAQTVGLEYVRDFVAENFLNCSPSIVGVGDTSEFPELAQISSWCSVKFY